MPEIIHVLYIREEDGWFAQCLDYDIAAQGESVEDAERAFFRTMHVQCVMDRNHGRKPLSSLRQAPERYWTLAKGVTEWRKQQDAEPCDSLPPAYVIAGCLEQRASRSSAPPP